MNGDTLLANLLAEQQFQLRTLLSTFKIIYQVFFIVKVVNYVHLCSKVNVNY